MGVVNVTPDSFFDGGQYRESEKAIARALELVKDGADIIDVGGESSRPFAEPVPENEELERVIPVIRGVRALSDVLISVDTYKAGVAREAFNAGATIINDISGLRMDRHMADTVSELGAHVIIMHMKGTPADMQKEPHYHDVVSEIMDFFRERISFSRAHGIREERIIIDPGIGFGKRVEDNLRIIRHLTSFRQIGRPLLIGTSMKSFIGQVTGAPPPDRSEGTLASIAISLWNGADIVRVHDVKKTQPVVALVDAIKKA